VSLFTQMILLATLSTLVPYFFCSLAVLIGRGAAPASPGSRAAAGARAVAAGAFLYAVVAIIGAGAEVLLWGLVLIGAGVPVYLWMALRRRASPSA
jgi:amino acid transporter